MSAATSPEDPVDDRTLAARFADFAADHQARAPLYADIARYAAQHPEVAAVLRPAPATQRLPVLLLAAVHDLLLAGRGADLARFYPNLTADPDPGDPGPAFGAFVRTHEAELAAILATRHTQTNEIGRCALLLPALGEVARQVGPLSLLDVGASAGLTMLLDRYAYRDRPGGDVGTSGPRLDCDTNGPVRGRPGPPRRHDDLGVVLPHRRTAGRLRGHLGRAGRDPGPHVAECRGPGAHRGPGPGQAGHRATQRAAPGHLAGRPPS